MSKGFNIAEEGHVAIGQYPVSMNGVTTLDAINMEGYAHLSAIIVAGATNGGAVTYTVKASTDASATSADSIAFNYYSETTASTDILGARTAATTSGFAGVNDSVSNTFHVIEIDASELPDGHNWVNITESGAATTTPGCVVYVLSGARYGSPESATVIA